MFLWREDPISDPCTNLGEPYPKRNENHDQSDQAPPIINVAVNYTDQKVATSFP
jgi:hypothetical protein